MVIGGGLAGLSAACAVADQGFSVTLLERRGFLGGRAFSFHDSETGLDLDNGQHVYLRCCTAYIDFLKKIGAFEQTTLQERLSITVSDREGKRGVLSAAPWLPAPLHLLPSLLLFPHLSWRDKLRVVRGMLSIRRTDRERRQSELEAENFRSWLERHGQSERSIAALWELITLPILNDSVSDVSAYMGIMAFQDALLNGRHSADLGYSRVGLTALVGEASREYLEERGGRVMFWQTVSAVEAQDGIVTGVTVRGEFMPADAVISAVPWDAIGQLLPQGMQTDAMPDPAPSLEWAPIVGLHVWYDRPVMDEDFMTALDSPVQWIFNKTRMQGVAGEGYYLLVSISAAWQEASMSRDELRTLVANELARILPPTATAQMTRFVSIKQPMATFRCVPGIQTTRPSQRTSLPGFYLAGDWTQTGWPATMESAVRSGALAATEASDQLSKRQ